VVKKLRCATAAPGSRMRRHLRGFAMRRTAKKKIKYRLHFPPQSVYDSHFREKRSKKFFEKV